MTENSKNQDLNDCFFKEQIVLVRTYSAGVHFGELVKKDGTNVLLKNARRLYFWKGCFTLSEIAVFGPKAGTRIACEVPFIELTQAIELIPISQQSLAILAGIHE